MQFDDSKGPTPVKFDSKKFTPVKFDSRGLTPVKLPEPEDQSVPESPFTLISGVSVTPEFIDSIIVSCNTVCVFYTCSSHIFCLGNAVRWFFSLYMQNFY
jgi:hypothetical protein